MTGFSFKKLGDFMEKRWHSSVGAAIVATAFLGLASGARAADVNNQRLVDADKNPADWLTYHGTYKSWHYSGLDQINTSTVKNLKGVCRDEEGIPVPCPGDMEKLKAKMKKMGIDMDCTDSNGVPIECPARK